MNLAEIDFSPFSRQWLGHRSILSLAKLRRQARTWNKRMYKDKVTITRQMRGLSTFANLGQRVLLKMIGPLKSQLVVRFPIVSPEIRAFILSRFDPVRDFSIALALQTIKREQLPGDMAELGVFKGKTSSLIHRLCPERRLYLFDTFEGFPAGDLETCSRDRRFDDSSVEYVSSLFNDQRNIVFRKGYFPETAIGLENSRFCFVMLDADLYKPTLAGLEFFYHRMAPGGYIFAHDYTSFESGRGVSRAIDQFLADKPEKVIELPDTWGSVVFRKL